jgi:hypothetical protein
VTQPAHPVTPSVTGIYGLRACLEQYLHALAGTVLQIGHMGPNAYPLGPVIAVTAWAARSAPWARRPT